MALIIQVLLYSVLFVLVYGQHTADHSDHRFQDRQRIVDLVNLSRLLQSAARLAYPITSSLNNAISKLMEPSNYPYSSHEIYSEYPPERAPHLNRNNARHNNLRADYSRRVNSHDANRRYSYNAPLHDFDYEYNYDYDYDYDNQHLLPYDSQEISNDFLFHDFDHLQSEPASIRANTGKTALLENVPNSKLKPVLVPGPDMSIDPDLIAKQPLPLVGFKNVEKSNKVMPIPVKEAPNHLPLFPNRANQDYVKPIANPNGQMRNHLTVGPGLIQSGRIPNLQNPPIVNEPATINYNNADGSSSPVSNTAQPKVIYVVLNPDSVDPTKNALHTLKNPELSVNDDVYYIAPNNAELGASNVNKPVSFIPVDGKF